MNNTLPLVSVITTSYNHEQYIEQAVRSIWNQSYSNIELIVLDDGSKDNSPEILQNLEKISPIPMTVILKENEGICKTLNLGLQHTQGKYLSFLASDDTCEKNKIERHVNILESKNDTNIAGCYGDYRIVDQHLKGLKNVIKTDMDNKNQFLDVLQRKHQFVLAASTFHLKVIKDLEFDTSLFFEDWDLFLRLSQKFYMFYVPGITYNYRKLDTGANRNIEKMFIAREQIFDKYKTNKLVKEYGVNKFEAQIAISNAISYFHIGDYNLAKPLILKAIKLDILTVVKKIDYVIKIYMGKSLVSFFRNIKSKLYRRNNR